MRRLSIAFAFALAARGALAAGLDDDIHKLQLAWDEVKYRRPAAEQDKII